MSMKMKMNSTICFTFLLLFSQLSIASISKKDIFTQKSSKQNFKKIAKKDLKLAIMALRLPYPNRLDALKKQGDNAFWALKKLAFDERQSLNVRWRAITVIARFPHKDALIVLEAALIHKKWFMRNAAILAMVNRNRSKALDWSQKLLSDKALVVRTAAVQTIHRLEGRETETLLWRKLYSRENFIKNKSLWIRKYIVSALASFAIKGREGKFIHILRDSDKRLYKYAVLGLEKITGVKLGKSAASIKSKRQHWLRWWKENKENA